MKRRKFITLVGGAAAWPLTARAQQPGVPVIGFLSGRSSGDPDDVMAAFREGLGESGFVEGRNLEIEYRWAEGRYRLPALAADLVRLKVAAIYASSMLRHALPKDATMTIPIVFGSVPAAIGGIAER
jgi:putative ABC transport system substrate-binding protein